MRTAGLEELPGINIGGRPLNNLRYADDTILTANSKQQGRLDNSDTTSQECK